LLGALSILRDYLDLTGGKYGCGEGQCGACTVLVDGKALRSCVTKVGTVTEKHVTTLEGIAGAFGLSRESSVPFAIFFLVHFLLLVG
jgi:aerobic-type carbon monoxide dehydrogenase small subunit (CoxS/CutS family)